MEVGKSLSPLNMYPGLRRRPIYPVAGIRQSKSAVKRTDGGPEPSLRTVFGLTSRAYITHLYTIYQYILVYIDRILCKRASLSQHRHRSGCMQTEYPSIEGGLRDGAPLDAHDLCILTSILGRVHITIYTRSNKRTTTSMEQAHIEMQSCR